MANEKAELYKKIKVLKTLVDRRGMGTESASSRRLTGKGLIAFRLGSFWREGNLNSDDGRHLVDV